MSLLRTINKPLHNILNNYSKLCNSTSITNMQKKLLHTKRTFMSTNTNMLLTMRNFTTKSQPKCILNTPSYLISINKMQSLKMHQQIIRTMTTNKDSLDEPISIFLMDF